MVSQQAVAVHERLRTISAGIDPAASLEEMRAIYNDFAALGTQPTAEIAAAVRTPVTT